MIELGGSKPVQINSQATSAPIRKLNNRLIIKVDKTSSSTFSAYSDLNDANRVTPVNAPGHFYGRETVACASNNVLVTNGAQPAAICATPEDRLSTGARTDLFYFANDPAARQGIIDQLRQQCGRVVCINSPSDLEKHGLMQQIWVADGRLHKATGRLFAPEPLTLVFDLTAMHPGEIASINDLLDAEPQCNGEPLGAEVRRVCLVNQSMLDGSRAANPDLWRRLGQMKETAFTGRAGLTDHELVQQITTVAVDKPLTTIDAATVDDWEHHLLGGITLDEHGQLLFAPGLLSTLKDGSHLLINNMPADYPDSLYAVLAGVLRAGGFEANRQWIRLPADLTLSFQSCRDLDALKAYMISDGAAFDPKKGAVCINGPVLDGLKGAFRVEGASVVRTNRLAQLCSGCEQLVITSPLSDGQWLWLSSSLARLPGRVQLFVDLAPDRILAPCWLEAQASESSEAFVYRVSAADSPESLVQQNLLSQNQCTFSLTYSPLMQHLVAGRPVALEAMEQNPGFAAHLESLLLPNPYLFIHGHKIDLPGSRVRFTGDRNSGSILFDRILPTTGAEGSVSPLYALMLNLPSSNGYPDQPPWSAREFSCRFDRLTEHESKQDLSSGRLPYHRRRAFHEMIKAYRADAEVYGFLKAKVAGHYPDKLIGQGADRSALRQWLSSHPEPDPGLLKSHFWRLARHCPVAVHEKIDRLDGVDQQALDKLAYYLVGAADSPHLLARCLRVDPHGASAQSYYDGTRRATLRDALVSARDDIQQGTVISKALFTMETIVASMLSKRWTDETKVLRLTIMLGYCFTGLELPLSCIGLVEALVAGKRHIPLRQERRLRRLADRIGQHPAVFLQGETGVGKTFMARAVAEKAGYQDCMVIQLGSDREALFGGQQLISENGDHCTRFEPGPLLQWAANCDNPPLLVLDEANLAPDDVIAPLAGLNCQPPVLNYLGHRHELTDRHRVIYTGNPAHYDGRSTIDPGQTPTFFYHHADQATLIETVILPDLPPYWSQADKQLACERLLALFNPFSELVQSRDVRGIKDVLATIAQILRHHQGSQSLNLGQITALIHRAFTDALGGGLDAEQGQKMATIDHWYRSQFCQDTSVLQGIDQAFAAFLVRLQRANSDVDLVSAPMTRLVYRYWLSLDKGNRGRRATVVTGPPGWGKDLVLDRVVRLWQPDRPLIHINANPDQWGPTVDAIKRAMTEGQVISVSELNVITSSNLESVLNTGLTDPAAAGFHLFATINPDSFMGRESFSPALKSRCTQFRVTLPSQPELVELLSRLPDLPDALPHWLAQRFAQWSQALISQNSPVHLALDDLFSSARKLSTYPSEQWPDALDQHLSLACRALKAPLGEPVPPCKEEERRIALERTANAVPGLRRPLWLKWGTVPGSEWQGGGLIQLVVPRSATVQTFISALHSTPPSRPVIDRSSIAPIDLGDIAYRAQFTVVQHFPPDQYSSLYYRIRFAHEFLDEDGRLSRCVLTWKNGSVRRLDSGGLSPFGTPGKGEVPGTVTLTLDHQWQALPALSDADQLRALRVQPEIPVELARSELTGQLLIRQVHQKPTRTVIDFMIIPQQRYFTGLTASDRVIFDESLCTPRLQKLFDDQVFYPRDTCQAFQELRAINRIETVWQRLQALTQWLETFDDRKNVGGKGETLLLNLLTHKQGVCRHKVLIFNLICSYWAIPSRRVVNEGTHAFVEVSPDGGRSWRLYQTHYQRLAHMPVAPDSASPGILSAPVPPPVSAHPPTQMRPPDVKSVMSEMEYLEKALGLKEMPLKAAIQLLLTRVSFQLTSQQWTQTCADYHLVRKWYLQFINLSLSDTDTHYAPPEWEVVLSPQFFHRFRHDIADWHTIIVNTLKRMEYLKNPRTYFYHTGYESLNSLIEQAPESMFDRGYIDWLSNLYRCSPDFFKTVLLSLLQRQVGFSWIDDSTKEQVTQLAMTCPLNPSMSDLPYWQGQDNKPLPRAARMIPHSESLSGKIVRRRIHQQRRYHPGPDSRLVPEKLLAGEPAFLDQRAVSSSRAIIVDCTGLEKKMLLKKIAISARAGIKPDIIKTLKPEINDVRQRQSGPLGGSEHGREMDTHDPYFELPLWLYISREWALLSVIESLFFFWLAAHHRGIEGEVPVWLCREYQLACTGKYPPSENYVSEQDSAKKPLFQLPPERIKAFFNQPSAVVVQSSELLKLLDEFLGLIRV